MANKFEYKLIDSGKYDDSPILFITEKNKYTQEESLELFLNMFWNKYKETHKMPSIKDFYKKNTYVKWDVYYQEYHQTNKNSGGAIETHCLSIKRKKYRTYEEIYGDT